jgi:PAS domain S-box-containing protein
MSFGPRRGIWLRWGVAAVAASAIGVWLTVTSDHNSQKLVTIVLILVVGWSFIAGGLVAWTRRPENRTGRLLALVGFIFLSGFLTESNDRALFALGAATSAIVLAAFIHLLLAYPTGELRSRGERVLVAFGWFVASIANLTTLFFERKPQCDGCPRNALLITDAPGVASALDVLYDVIGALIMIGVVVLLVRHYRAATAAARRRLALIIGSGVLVLLLLFLSFAVDPASPPASDILATGALLVCATVPFFFLTGLMRTRLARGGVAELLVEVRESAALEDAQAGLRRLLRDPELQLAGWAPHRGRFVDTDGREVVDTEDAKRVTTIVRSETGDAVAALVHDRALLDEPELFDGALAAARLALQRSRLQEELRGRLDELQRERDFIATVVNSAPAFHAVLDPAGRIVRFNEPLVVASGVPDDDGSRGRYFWELFPVAEDAEAVGTAILAGEGVEHEHRWRAAGGAELVVAWKVQRLVDGLGRARLLVSGIDVTERKRHEDELRRQRDFLRLVGSATPTLMCVVDADGVIDSRGVNTAFATATGHGDETAVGSVFWEIAVTAEHRDAVASAFRGAVADGDEHHHETPWLAANGRALLVEWWTTPLAALGEGTYLVCGVDVTERVLQADEIRRSRARLVEAGDAERRRLERNLHDGAQQRLVSLSLALRLAQSRLASDPEGAAELLASAGQELALALQELRELARGLHPAVLADRGLGPALESLAERSPVPVELDAEVGERLPEPVEVAAFYVVSESLANVAKYAHATSARVCVSRSPGALELEIADDGIGGADPARGTGLRGLVDRVDALGGALELDSPPGGGTRVHATLPVRSAVPQDAG